MGSPDLLLIGREGQLARSLAERASGFGLVAVSVGRPELELADPQSIEVAVSRSTAPFIINSAAYTAVDQAESERDLAWQVNAEAPRRIAEAAASRGARLVHISTDYVFDGRGSGFYSEQDATAPLGVYGESKLAGEEAVRSAGADHVIVRTAWVYSPFGRNFMKTMLGLAQTRDEVRVVDDQVGTPTSALDLADGLLTMVKAWRSEPARGAGQTYHLAGTGEASWASFAREIFASSARLGGPSAQVTPISTSEYPTPARRPADSRLSSEKFAETFSYRCPPWQDSVRETAARLLAEPA